jgi:hypothetical protein
VGWNNAQRATGIGQGEAASLETPPIPSMHSSHLSRTPASPHLSRRALAPSRLARHLLTVSKPELPHSQRSLAGRSKRPRG